MQRYFIKRLIVGILTVFCTITIVFFVTRGVGEVDPTAVVLPPNAPLETQLKLREKFGLDKPIWQQYFIYLKNLSQGDLGTSFVFKEPVKDLMKQRIPATLQLTVSALLVVIIFGMTLGVVSAIRRDSIFDRFSRVISLFGMAIPDFALALFLILLFGVTLRWLPVAGRGGLEHYVLPVLSMSLAGMAGLMRLSRSSMLEVLNSEVIVMARIKGVPEPFVVLVHALKNACIPVITIIGMVIPGMVTGSVVVETIFSWPGVGNLAMTSIFARDYPVIQAIVIVVSSLIVLSNLLVDMVYALIDPRIRYT
jgi:ABC-type dipeptide/oligopeptide/nickel transport system permease component